MKLYKRILFVIPFLLGSIYGNGQYRQASSSEILLKLKKLNVLGSALYFAAHPDDENTRLIGYLATGELVNTAYLGLTRGDGGQNLIGPELREGLGLIRTQELLAARRVDGSQQFFSRANDFGYSKTPEETLKIWDKDQVLHDAVWAIRKFRPDVIITRFPPDSRAGHGHHTSSAIIAEEAFDVAATNQYPEQLKTTSSWQPTRLMMNTGRWWNPEMEKEEGVIKVDIGSFNPMLGESYSEMSGRSRSMHKSQGFGSQGSRGSYFEYLGMVKGTVTSTTIFDGIDITWNRVNSPAITKSVDKLIKEYDASRPYASVPALIAVHKEVSSISDEFWKKKKLAEIEELILDCSGLYIAAWASDFTVVPGSSLEFTYEIVNRSPVDWQLDQIAYLGFDSTVNLGLEENQKLGLKKEIKVSTDKPYSGPYWLEKEGSLGMYRVDDLNLIGTPENAAPFSTKVSLSIGDFKMKKVIPLVYKWTDRVNGEMRRPITVVPPAFLNLSNPVYIFNNGEAKEIEVQVEAGLDELNGMVSLDVPDGWIVSPANVNVAIAEKWGTETLKFKVTPSENRSGDIKAKIEVDGKEFSRSKYEIKYLHIPYQIMLPVAKSRAENLDVVNMAQTVGYVMGAGDQVPEGLEQMGIKVWLMSESDITSANLEQLDALVFGIRAANTLDWIASKKSVMEEYMNTGGTVIMQYNTTRRLSWESFAPYELDFSGRSSDSRVAEEDAEIRILKPDHKVLNYPNKITQNDFDGWVQERGLYFPSAWDAKYEAIISSNDEGESPKDGSLLIAEFGQGYFVYTGLSWFRELPAGVPGAYRFFSNVLSLGSKVATEPVKLEKSKKKRSQK